MKDTTDKHILQVIGGKFKEVRTKAGLSQRKVAMIAGIEYNQVQKLEKGESNLQLTTYVKLLLALDTPFNEMIPNKEDFSNQ